MKKLDIYIKKHLHMLLLILIAHVKAFEKRLSLFLAFMSQTCFNNE